MPDERVVLRLPDRLVRGLKRIAIAEDTSVQTVIARCIFYKYNRDDWRVKRGQKLVDGINEILVAIMEPTLDSSERRLLMERQQYARY